MDSTAVIGSIVAAFFGGSALTTITQFLLKRSNQPLEQYQKLVETLERRVAKLEQDHQDCLKDHANNQRQIGYMEGQINELRDMVKPVAQAAISQMSGPLSSVSPAQQ